MLFLTTQKPCYTDNPENGACCWIYMCVLDNQDHRLNPLQWAMCNYGRVTNEQHQKEKGFTFEKTAG